MSGRISAAMNACGAEGMPRQIECCNSLYRQEKVFKHDFFAATGLYQRVTTPSDSTDCPPDRVVLKINRNKSFLGLPMRWIGRSLRNRETNNLKRLEGMEQVPHLLGLWESCGFLYTYIDGCSLDQSPDLPDSFFDDLENLLKRTHQRGIAYLDLNKRGNILVDKEGKPNLIDFQISVHLGKGWGWLRNMLQKEDVYHLLKHKRRLRPDLLTKAERIQSKRKSIWIRIHRIISFPYRIVRRWILGWMLRHDYLHTDPNIECSPENNPQRYL